MKSTPRTKDLPKSSSTKTTSASNNSQKRFWLSRIFCLSIIIFVVALTVSIVAAKFIYEGVGVGNGLHPGTSSQQTVLRGVFNFRTVGVDGKMKAGILWRSTRLSGATEDDAEYLAKLLRGGLVVDLRTAAERKRIPDRSIPGVFNENFPIRGAASAGGYVAAFVNNAADRAQFGLAFTAIANAKGNVLIHCNYGKDRTGWLVATVMYSLGANDSQVLTEYLKSNNQVKGATVDADWLNAGLNAARQKYGSIDKYIREGLGVSDETITKLKTKFAV